MTEETPPRARAWQPFTPRGVAAFAHSRSARLVYAQLVAALLFTGITVWFFETNVAPLILEVAVQIPDEAAIENGRWTNLTERVSAANRFLTLIAEPASDAAADTTSDFRFELRNARWSLCWVAGCVKDNYHRRWLLGRSTVEPWWGAWHPVVVGGIALATICSLFLSWSVVATVNCPMARVLAYCADRDASWGGSWRLCAAALLPGALLMSLGFFLYGLGAIDLIHFLGMFVAHVAVGLIYTLLAPFFLPPLRTETTVKKNPFASSGS